MRTRDYMRTQTSYLVASDDILEKSYSSKLQAATRHGIPVVTLDFLKDCAEAGGLVSAKPYLLQAGNCASSGNGTSHLPLLSLFLVCGGACAMDRVRLC